MNVNLTPDLEAIVREKVANGLYNNQSEVLREGLRLLIHRDSEQAASLNYWKDAFDEGLDDAENGRFVNGPQTLEDLRQTLQSRLNS